MSSSFGQTRRPFRQGESFQKAGRPWRPVPLPRPSEAPEVPFGPLIQELKLDSLAHQVDAFEHNATISGCKLVTSFNWLDSPEPTILIPGQPPRWTPPATATRLREDSGKYFRDKNAARYPKHPMEAAVLASLETWPALTTGVNVVACGSTLGNLLRFVRNEDKLFRMLIEVVDDTVFIIRRENSPTELIPDVRGFGHTFPEAYTTWDPEVKGSASHQRVLRYQFGGLKFMVRFEADGYIADKSTASKTFQVSPEMLSVDDVTAALTGMQVKSDVPKSDTGIHIKHAGQSIAQDLVFDLKTRSARKKDQDVLGQELPRMWVTQIPRFVLAYHNNGLFNDIVVSDVRDKVDEWEKEHQRELAKLASLVHQMVDLATKHGRLDICHRQTGVLEIRNQLPGAGDALSEHVKSMWISRGAVGHGEEEEEEEASDSDADKDGDGGIRWNEDEDEDEDFTACSPSCGYCGTCTY